MLLARGQLAAHHGPQGLSSRAAPRQAVSSLYHCRGLFLPESRTFHLFLLDFRRFVGPFLPLVYVSLSSSPALECICWSPTLVSSANCTSVRSITSSRSVMKMLNRTHPRTEHKTNRSHNRGSATGSHEDLFPPFLAQGSVTLFSLFQCNRYEIFHTPNKAPQNHMTSCAATHQINSAFLEQQCPSPVHSVQKWNSPAQTVSK